MKQESKNLQKIAIIGGGISGLTMANLLKGYNVTIFEKEEVAGGLIRCKRIEGSLYHICGGHVFNSKRQDVLDWFWNHFNRDKEFSKADRNSVVYIDNETIVPYPIENHMYLFNESVQKSFISDLVKMAKNENVQPTNFEEFLANRFGQTLYQLYFKPYNEKIWRRDLKHVPLTWLEGKLPMPTIEEMIYNNINQVKEKEFVHSSFWYEKENGSQFIANRLSQGLNIKYNAEIHDITLKDDKWIVDGECFDSVVFCGNIKDLPQILKGVSMEKFNKDIDALEYHGTTSVFCEIEKNPFSWIYLPDQSHLSHRIICTGNFAESNNADGKMTATIEFTDYISEEDIKENLKKIPLHPKYLAHHYNKYTYPIQDIHTKDLITQLKQYLSGFNFFFTGRFADWEYYNMDVAMGAAMDLCKKQFSYS